MRRLSFLAALAFAMGAASVYANTVLVTPTSMGNWSLFTTDASIIPGTGSATDTAAIVTGPSDPNTDGSGSVLLATGPGNGDHSAQLRDSTDWVGTKVSDLTTLSYSTYVTASNQSPPSQDSWLDIYIDNNNDGVYDDRLVFEPIYSDGGDVTNPNGPEAVPAFDTWQTWDLLKGMWYSDNFGGPGANALTWSQILTDEGPDATIVDDTPDGLGGIRFTVGEGSTTDNFSVNVDDFTIGTASNTVKYNFEPGAAVPLPASVWSGIALLGGLGLIGGYKRLRQMA